MSHSNDNVHEYKCNETRFTIKPRVRIHDIDLFGNEAFYEKKHHFVSFSIHFITWKIQSLYV